MPLQLNITRPLPAEVEGFWAVIERERAGMYQPPATLGEVVTAWGFEMLLFLGTVDTLPAALFLIRDPVFCPTTGATQTGWVTAVVHPFARGAVAQALASLALATAATWGFHTCWTGCLVQNQPAQRFALACGFQRCVPPGIVAPTATFFVWHSRSMYAP